MLCIFEKEMDIKSSYSLNKGEKDRPGAAVAAEAIIIVIETQSETKLLLMLNSCHQMSEISAIQRTIYIFTM